MRVLVLSPSLPWPLDAGGRIRTFHLLRELRRSHEIALWCVRQPGAGAGSERALGGICDELRVFERSARGRLERLAAPRPEPDPLTVPDAVSPGVFHVHGNL